MKGLNHQLQLDIQIRKIEVVAANFFNSEQFGFGNLFIFTIIDLGK